MSFVESFAPHLPYLRRYARAVSGSQSLGDGLVRQALESLVEAPNDLDLTLSAQVALYKYFHQTSLEGAAHRSTSATASEADDRLQRLAPLHRQAFLLSAVEGFASADIAEILQVTVETARGLIEQAQTEIEAQLRTAVMIVEDEPFIASDLEAIVSDLGHDVTGIAVTRREAVALVNKKPPGIVLCDIQLADNSSGIDAANDILVDHDVPLIFITAFPERLLTGDKPEPAYLITKPFQANTVKATIGQALFFHSTNHA